MNELDWLQEVYKDYCSKHGLDHVSTCEQSGLTPKQWEWIDQFNNYWDEAQNKRAMNKKLESKVLDLAEEQLEKRIEKIKKDIEYYKTLRTRFTIA